YLARLVGDLSKRQSKHLRSVFDRWRRRRFFAAITALDTRGSDFLLLKQPDLDLQRDALPIAHDLDIDAVAGGGVGDEARQLAHALHRLAVELDDDVTLLDAGLGGGAVVRQPGDEGALCLHHAKPRGDLVGHVLDAHADPAAVHLPETPKLLDDRHRDLRRDGEGDADRAAGRGHDRRIDADHFAAEIEERSAGIATVHRGVSLDVVVVGTG